MPIMHVPSFADRLWHFPFTSQQWTWQFSLRLCLSQNSGDHLLLKLTHLIQYFTRPSWFTFWEVYGGSYRICQIPRLFNDDRSVSSFFSRTHCSVWPIFQLNSTFRSMWQCWNHSNELEEMMKRRELQHWISFGRKLCCVVGIVKDIRGSQSGWWRNVSRTREVGGESSQIFKCNSEWFRKKLCESISKRSHLHDDTVNVHPHKKFTSDCLLKLWIRSEKVRLLNAHNLKVDNWDTFLNGHSQICERYDLHDRRSSQKLAFFKTGIPEENPDRFHKKNRIGNPFLLSRQHRKKCFPANPPGGDNTF
jgi:hypothetical protein